MLSPMKSVIGGVVLDGVAAIALGVEGVQFRQVLVGLATEREHFRAAPVPPEIRQRGRFSRGAVGADGILKRRIA